MEKFSKPSTIIAHIKVIVSHSGLLSLLHCFWAWMTLSVSHWPDVETKQKSSFTLSELLIRRRDERLIRHCQDGPSPLYVSFMCSSFDFRGDTRAGSLLWHSRLCRSGGRDGRSKRSPHITSRHHSSHQHVYKLHTFSSRFLNFDLFSNKWISFVILWVEAVDPVRRADHSSLCTVPLNSSHLSLEQQYLRISECFCDLLSAN